MGMSASQFTVGKVAKRCTTFPDVWAAIVGCTGRGSAWRYTVGHFGRRTVEYACPTCQAARERLDGLVGPAHHAALLELSETAGVADYRIAEVVRRDGRPVLTGRVDADKAYQAADAALQAFAQGGSARQAARAILAYGRDCKALVAQYCTPAQRAELAQAYKAERLVA
jgi:hypothetical protein